MPSPQATETLLIALPFVAGTVTAIVNDAGSPLLTDAGGVMTIVGALAIAIEALPDAVPDADGVVDVVGVPVVGVPVVGVPVDVDVPTPTLAVTVAASDVVIVLFAVPAASVFTTLALSVPVVVENVTGTPAIRLPLTSNTTALTVLDPPAAAIVAGLALTTTF